MPSVAVIGTRGYPSYYGGFETAVRKIAPDLTDRGWSVTVYGRRGATRPDDPTMDGRIDTRDTVGVESRNLSTLSHGLTATLNAAGRRPDVALVFNVANGYFLPLLRARRIPTLVNVDGIEWERAKWSAPAKRVFRTGATLTARWADGLIFDAQAIADYWRQAFGTRGTVIAYGGDVPPALDVPPGLRRRGYVLMVARFVPENTVQEFLEAATFIASRYPVVIVGDSGYGGELDDIARRLAATHQSVRWLGHVSDDALLLALWQHAGVYFHGHSVGGTNPALVQAMAAGAPILARDTVYNREVLGSEGNFVTPEPEAITAAISAMMSNPSALEAASLANTARAQERYSWSQICRDYDHALRTLLATRRLGARAGQRTAI